MIYGSVCSGIEAATVAWHPLGWRASFYSEIDPFARSVLAHHYPDVPLHGDFTTIQAGDYATVDLFVGGTPCQSFSVAGLRGGLDDDRGNLALEFLRLADRLRPRWLVWENVPGVLSSSGGRDFGSILGGMVELGYGFAYRVLDAQYVRVERFSHAVPQRRRRVFVVGYLGDWRRAAAVLFERHSLSGHPAPRRQARERVAGTLAAGAHPGGHNGQDDDGKFLVAHALRAEGFDASEDGTGRGTPLVPVGFTLHGTDITRSVASFTDTASALRARIPGAVENSTTTAVMQPIAFHPTQEPIHSADVSHALGTGSAGGCATAAVAFDLRGREDGAMPEGPHDTANIRAASGGSSRSYVASPMAVRRLTPVECERLQGFPDDYTLVPHRGKPAADGPRYKALGNSMAVNCMAWIGQRIAAVDALVLDSPIDSSRATQQPCGSAAGSGIRSFSEKTPAEPR